MLPSYEEWSFIQTNITSEIDYDIPFGLPGHTYDEGKPLFVAFGCVLFERETPKGYSYHALNLESGRSARVAYRKAPLEGENFEKTAAKIGTMPIAGPSRLNIEKGPGNKVPSDRLAAMLQRVFRELLPAQGYSLRQPQAELAAHILDCLLGRRITLAEAEVGIGKTLAYLTAAALVKRGRANDFWFRGRFPGQSWADSAFLPVVVSTSSIALQNALVRDYIPELSRVLVEAGVIKTPLSCVLRKGREHYLCERRLRNCLADADEKTTRVLAPLLAHTAPIDLADVEHLTPYMKRRVGVTGRCDFNCPHRESCRHRLHQKHVQSNRHDFQVCNHQFLLADVLRRRDKQAPLLPHYQAVIIDEGHKFLAAARQMYGAELAAGDILPVTEDIRGLTFKTTREGDYSGSKIYRDAKKLCGQAKRLVKHLAAITAAVSNPDEETERQSVALDTDAARHLRNIRRISAELLAALPEQPVATRHTGRHAHILWALENIHKRAAVLEQHGNLICWTEQRGADTALCAIPKNLDEQLWCDFWGKGIPIVLTSGTLSAAGQNLPGGDFGHIKRSLGLHRLQPAYLTETSQPSPFDHTANTLLYISERVPFPDNQSRDYLLVLADEVERLVRAAHGHAAVLFTSYKAMDMVREMLEARGLPFPLFQMRRGDAGAIGRFKESTGGILFASGALWEGIDIPGDALSLLIIPRLPFAAPDAISEHERTLYPDMAAYKVSVVVPDMLVKLKQGFGRLIRTETDSGVVAILDHRAREGGSYRQRVLRALPACRVTSDVSEVVRFLRSKKQTDFFCEVGL